MKRNLSNESRQKIIEATIKGNKSKSLKKQEIYNVNPKFCNNCQKILPYEKRGSKFCCRSCAATFNNKKFIKKPKPIDHKQNEFCLYCNKKIKRGNFCNRKCSNFHKLNEKINQWLNGQEISLGTIRNYLLTKNNFKCQMCNWGETNTFTGKIPLELHHIDGDSDNNRPDNLQILCPNCHSLTVNYKGANKNSKRINRKNYYKS